MLVLRSMFFFVVSLYCGLKNNVFLIRLLLGEFFCVNGIRIYALYNTIIYWKLLFTVMFAKFIEFICVVRVRVCGQFAAPSFGDNQNLRTLKISVGIFGIDTKLFDSFIHIRLFCSFWLPEVYRADSAARYLDTASGMIYTQRTESSKCMSSSCSICVSMLWNV